MYKSSCIQKKKRGCKLEAPEPNQQKCTNLEMQPHWNHINLGIRTTQEFRWPTGHTHRHTALTHQLDQQNSLGKQSYFIFQAFQGSNTLLCSVIMYPSSKNSYACHIRPKSWKPYQDTFKGNNVSCIYLHLPPKLQM